jgi:hypothetical protein
MIPREVAALELSLEELDPPLENAFGADGQAPERSPAKEERGRVVEVDDPERAVLLVDLHDRERGVSDLPHLADW